MTETSGESVVVRAPAKVNLGLWVGPPRPDGFHSLATVFHAVDLFDELVVSLAPEWSVEVSGRHTESVPTDRGNLVWRAGQLIAEHFDLDDACRIHIHKSIPVAGGMAGGSADAAATLVGLDSLLTLGLDRDSLMDLAADLGSDVPFSVAGGTALGSGRGEKLAPVLTKGIYHWVFALHDEGLSTPDVYAECDRLRGRRTVAEPAPSATMMAALRSGDAVAVARALHNDLQPAAISLLPRIQHTLDEGLDNGALGGVVSGSGPTVAFLCSDRKSQLDLMVALTASGVADDVVSANGPAHGAHIVREVSA